MPEDAPADLQALLKRVEHLEAKLTETLDELVATKAELAAAKTELARKDQIIAALQQRLFGSSSERLDPDQLNLELDEAILGKPEPAPQTGGGDESGMEEEDGDGNPKRKRRRKADLFPRNLKILIEGIDIPEEVTADPDAFVEIGEEHHDELDITRAAVFWRRRIRRKFVSRKDRKRAPLMRPAPRPSVPGCHCAPGLMAQIIADKFTDHLPHYRQEQRFLRRHGVELRRQTINTWTHAAAAWLMPIGQAIKRELLGNEVLQVDETPIRYLNPGHGKTSRGYLWVYLDPQSATVYYDWQLGRGHDCLLDFLGYDAATNTILYEGLLQCDGYSAYQALASRFAGIKLAGCLAHIRRKFMEAREQASEIVLPILALMQKLYRIESWVNNDTATSDCRLLVRRTHSRPLVEELRAVIETERKEHLPHSKLGEAITYAFGQWDEFVRYLDDGRIEIDNNLCENAVRPTKLGEKNHLFFGSAEAGIANALLYTLVRNCRVHDIDPEVYLAEAIRRMTENPTDDEAAALTPSKLAPMLRPAVVSDAA
jgi:transposase